jgi:hypothetical protein
VIPQPFKVVVDVGFECDFRALFGDDESADEGDEDDDDGAEGDECLLHG